MVVWGKRDDAKYIIGVISGGHFVSHIYLLAYPPLFPFLQTEFTISTTQLGLLVTAIYIPTLLFQIPMGELVDRIGAKSVLVAGIVVTSVGITLSGFANEYWILLLFAFLSGLGQTVFHPADYALIDVVTEEGTEGKAFSIHTFGGFAGFAAAPILIGGIAILYSWQVSLVAVGAFGFIYAAFILFTVDPIYTRSITTQTEGNSRNTGWKLSSRSILQAKPIHSIQTSLNPLFQRELLLIFGFYLVNMMAIVGLQSFITLFGVEVFGFSESIANFILTTFLVAQAVGILLGGPIADRVTYQLFLIGTLVFASIAVWATVLTVPIAGLMLVTVAIAIIGFLMGAALPSRDKLANSFADAEATGKSFGFYFTGLSLGAVVSPILLGYIIDLYSVRAAFNVIGVFLISSAFIVVLTHRISAFEGVDSAP